jgi:signal transduction histidine kinase
MAKEHTIKDGLLSHFHGYQFDLKHVTLLFVVLLVSQLVVSILHKTSLAKFLVRTQEWYQQDSAERLANLTTTSLELLLEGHRSGANPSTREARKVIQGLNIILSQQLLNQNVREICVLVPAEGGISAIDDGNVLYEYMFTGRRTLPRTATNHDAALALYRQHEVEMRGNEQIKALVEGRQTFHVFVPFVPRGEFTGAVYMKNTPDFGFLSREIITNYDQVALTFSALILFGLLAMFYVSSYTLKQRNDALSQLFQSEKEHLAEQIHYEKELLFTKRIYHTHHKAEKIMGFIKEDVRNLTAESIETIKNRVARYSNFVARVIYDMKWFDPPVQTIRNPAFHTDINSVIKFLVDDVFLRIVHNRGRIRFDLALDPTLPVVHINEYVIWEVLEPIIQNAVEHSGSPSVIISIATTYDAQNKRGTIRITDNGKGIEPWLLEYDSQGVRKLFKERVSSKDAGDSEHAGYGCYLAYEIARQRCGWLLDAENLQGGGCTFVCSFGV